MRYEIPNRGKNARGLSFATLLWEIIAGLSVTPEYLVTYFRHVLIRKY